MSSVIQNVRIIDGNGGSPIEGGAIAFDDRRITYVGPGTGAPPADRVLDARGGSAIPGLINCHTHITIDEADAVTPRRHYLEGEALGLFEAAARGRRALRNGITALRDCNAPGRGTFALRTAFDRGVLPGPRLFLSGQAICATGGHMRSMSYEADGPDEVRKGVRTQLMAGADFIKLVAEASSSGGAFARPSLQLTANEMGAAVEVAHRLGKRVTAHAVTRAGVAEALQAGVDAIEHGYDLTDDLIEIMRTRGTWLVPTLSVQDALLRGGAAAGWGDDRLAGSRRILEMALDSVRRAVRAGVRVVCGSDAGSPFNPVWELVPELRLLVRAGMTPVAALSAATRDAASCLGVEAELGTLEVGKLADIVVVVGDPSSDVDSLGRVATVIKDGEVVLEGQ